MMDIKNGQLANQACLIANKGGIEHGAVVVVGGTKLMRRISRLVEKGELDVDRLPFLVGVDSENELRDFTPWWHPAFKKEADDFGGAGDAYLADVVLPVARETRALLTESGSREAPLAIMGYSLGGLLCLQSLMVSDLFDVCLVASPSVWYPGFVNRLERSDIVHDGRVVIACGKNEGAGHPEPIAGIRQDVDRVFAILESRLSLPPSIVIDEGDHHQGLNERLCTLLRFFPDIR